MPSEETLLSLRLLGPHLPYLWWLHVLFAKWERKWVKNMACMAGLSLPESLRTGSWCTLLSVSARSRRGTGGGCDNSGSGRLQ